MQPLTNAELSRRVTLIKEISELVDAYGRENEKLRAENRKLEARCKWLDNLLRTLHPEDWK